MDSTQQAPIGVFDSGVGGLSVLRAIRRELPHENLIYIADSAHAPYGDRDRDYVEARAMALLDYLSKAGAKAVVVACNTATVIAAERLRASYALPIIAMEPAIKPAASCTRSKVIGVLATTQTLASPSVARLCERHGDGISILLQPCPGLVEQIERGNIAGDATRVLLTNYLSPLLAAGADTLVLGCTHYLFLEPLIRELAGPEVAVVDSSAAVARELRRRLGSAVRGVSDGDGCEELLTTAETVVDLQRVIRQLWSAAASVKRLA
ncbi:MAG TPA: glutamate racemase [Rhodocyclaceae bacterium]